MTLVLGVITTAKEVKVNGWGMERPIEQLPFSWQRIMRVQLWRVQHGFWRLTTVC